MLSNVQLILLFNIYNVVKSVKNFQADVDDQVELYESHYNGATSNEREIQTDLHPIPYHKDENYVWNLWDLRRKAIELVTFDNFKF